MKTYRYLISAALVLLGFTACQKGVMPQPQEDGTGTLVEVTVGADFVTTKTTMGDNGDVLWSAGDSIAVTVGENNYKFAIVSGAGTTSARFAGAVTEDDAAILKGTATGTVTAYYPTSGTSVPTTQTYAEGTFADGMNPMTATFDKATKTLTFTNNAAVVRIKGVSKTAASAALTYTVGEQNHTVTMALTSGETAKDLYFVVVPGTKDFQFSLDGASAVDYETSAVTEAGKRYDLDKPSIKVGSESALVNAITNASDGDIIKFTSNITMTSALPINNSVTIDLNNKVLSTGNMDGAPVKDNRAIDAHADVIIKNGTVNGPHINFGYGLMMAYNGGSLTLENVNATTTGICVISRGSSAPVTINSGAYTSTSSTPKEWKDQGSGCAVVAQSGGIVTIKGGTFTGAYFAVGIFTSGGTINIEGGEFNVGAYEASCKNASETYSCSLLNDASWDDYKATGNLNISGGTIHGDVRGRRSDAPGHHTNLTITGGDFDTNPYCMLLNFDFDRITLNDDEYSIDDNGTMPIYNGKVWKLTYGE